MAKEKTAFEKLLEEEYEKRVSEMESPDDEFPPKMGKTGYIVSFTFMILCLIGILLGASV